MEAASAVSPPKDVALCGSVKEGAVFRCKYDDRRAMLEPSHFLTLAKRRPAGNFDFPAVFPVQQDIEKMQTNAGDKDCGYRHQGNHESRLVQHGRNDRALILTKQFGNPVECDRIDVPRASR